MNRASISSEVLYDSSTIKEYKSNLDDYLRPNKYLCEFLGMMPTRSSTLSTLRSLSVYLRISLTFFAINTLFVPQLLLVIINWGDIVILTSVGCVTITVGQVLFKIVYLLCRRDKVLRMYDLVIELWEMSEDHEDARAIEKYAHQARLFTVIFVICGFSNNVSFTVAATINALDIRRNHNNDTDYIKGMLLDVWYGNRAMSWTSLKIAFGCQSLAAIFFCIATVGLDTSMMTLVLHICSQFLLVKCWLRKIGAKIKIHVTKSDDNLSRAFGENVRRDIVKCIQHHKKMLLIAEELDDLLNPVILMQFTTSGIEICLSGFALMHSATTSSDLVKFTCYLVTMVAQLVLWCWPGEILNCESLGIGDAVYMDLPWYELTRELQNDVCLVIVRSQRECQITAMKFQSMSIRTLACIFNTAGSYFALLRQVQANESAVESTS